MTRKFMAIHGAPHSKNDVDRVCFSRAMRGRELISCEGCTRMKKTTWYVRDSVGASIRGVKAAETIEYNSKFNKKEFKQSWKKEKRNYGKTN